MIGETYKPGVSGTPSQAISYAISVAGQIFSSYGVTLVITSIRDGQHMTGSLHYSGNAADFRRWDLDRIGKTSAAVAQLRSQLGSAYDVILESDHIHVEYEGRATPTTNPLPVGSNPGLPPPPGGGPQLSSTWLLVAAAVVVILVTR
jgi:hypothetical protein